MTGTPTFRNVAVAVVAMLIWFTLFYVGVFSRLFWLPGALPLVCAIVAAGVYMSFHARPAFRSLVALLSPLPFIAYWHFFEAPAREAANSPLAGAFLLMLGLGIVVGALLPLAYAAVRGMKPNSTPHPDARDVPASASSGGARAGGRER
jgi:hypothetical protein